MALALLHDVGAIAEQLALRHGVQLLGFEGTALTVVPEGIGAAAATDTDTSRRASSAPPHSSGARARWRQLRRLTQRLSG